MRTLCTTISFLLHGSVILAALYWPVSTGKISLELPVYNVSLVALPTPVQHNRPKPGAPKSVTPKPAPKPQGPEDAAPIPVAPKPVPPEASPPKALLKPLPKEDKAAPTPKPKPDTQKKPAPPQPTQKKPKAPSADDILKQALASAGAEVKKRTQQEQRHVEDELAALRTAVSSRTNDSDGGTDGGQGGQSIGSGLGLVAIYRAQVIELVRTHWRFPQLAKRTNLATVLRIRLAPDGTLLDVTMETSSGRPDYDSSTISAVRSAGALPPPPLSELQDLRITFTLQDML